VVEAKGRRGGCGWSIRLGRRDQCDTWFGHTAGHGAGGSGDHGIDSADLLPFARHDDHGRPADDDDARHRIIGGFRGSRDSRYPPTTLNQFKAFAGTGDSTAIHAFFSDTKGSPSCPKPNISATADPGVTGRQLEADESAFFLQRGLVDQPCSAFLFLFHSQTETDDNGFTVGRVNMDVPMSGATHTIEVDTGDAPASPSYRFSY